MKHFDIYIGKFEDVQVVGSLTGSYFWWTATSIQITCLARVMISDMLFEVGC